MHDQHLDQRATDILGAGRQFLPGQVQRRPQAHAHSVARPRGDADQVDAQAHPLQEIDFLPGEVLLDDANDVHDGVDEGHDVADHRQAARNRAQAFERDVVVADLAQPLVEGGGAGADVLLVDGVEWGNRDFGRPLEGLGRDLCAFGHGGL